MFLDLEVFRLKIKIRSFIYISMFRELKGFQNFWGICVKSSMGLENIIEILIDL